MENFINEKHLQIKEIAKELRQDADKVTEENKVYYWKKLQVALKSYQEVLTTITEKLDQN